MKVLIGKRSIYMYDPRTGINVFACRDGSNDCTYDIPVPHLVQFQLTTRCNRRCWFCYVDKSNVIDVDPKILEKVLKILDRIGVCKIAFGGGEPLTYPHLSILKKVRKEVNMSFSITTNADLIDKWIDVLKEIDAVRISIYSEDAVEKIEKLRQEGIYVTISYLHLGDEKLLNLTIDLVRKFNIRDPLFLMYRGKLFKYSDEQLNKYIAKIVKLIENGYQVLVDCQLRKYIPRKYILDPFNLDPFNLGNECGAGKTMIAITPRLTVKACSMCKTEIPFETWLKHVLNKKPSIEILKKDCEL